jgi:hypothetical protein
MTDFKGDIHVARTGQFGRRANQGLTFVPPLAAPYFLQPHSHWWSRLQTDGLGAQIVHLPDPAGILNGWATVVQNDSASDDLIIQKSTGAYVETIPPGRAMDFTLIDATVSGGQWYSDGVLELHEEVLFDVGDWLGNQIFIIPQGVPGAGEVGPHRLPVGGTYSVTVWQDLPGSNARVVNVSLYVDRSTGRIRLLKAGGAPEFSGRAFLCARM